jgi:hypothetical protein
MTTTRGIACLIALIAFLLTDAFHAAQKRPTFREVLTDAPGASGLENFYDEFLDSRVPEPKPGRKFVLARVHINPSAERLLVISSDFKLVRELMGWELAILPNESIVYHQNQAHFAPTHSLEISVFDPSTMIDRQIYPPAAEGDERRRFVERVEKAYNAIGEDWFREHNHPMDPSRFDSALAGTVTVDERAGTITFRVTFGGREPLTFSEQVLVTCAPLSPADRIQCSEAPRLGQAQNQDWHRVEE